MLKGGNIHFSLFDESHFSNICTLEYVIIEFMKINWLCKLMKKVGRNSMNSCTEWSKKVFPVSIVKKNLKKNKKI